MKGSGLTPLDEPKTNEEVHVFGRNLEERVVTKDDDDESPSLTFETNLANQSQEEDIEQIRKRKFDAMTGEEDEETIFQGDFKLFVWDLTTSNWIEKGRGQLKLNDSIDRDKNRSRLIMRIGGTLRIILNVAINTPFFRVIANSKTNIRFTDSQTVWAASGSNANQLKDLIEERLRLITTNQDNLDTGELRKKTKAESEGTSSPDRTKESCDSSNQNISTASTTTNNDKSTADSNSDAEKQSEGEASVRESDDDTQDYKNEENSTTDVDQSRNKSSGDDEQQEDEG